jgi:transcriptional regulator with XRE-family HTH domain
LEIIFMKKTFASRLLSLCNGKSIAECARSWGIKQASLDRYVKEQRTPTGEAIVEICKATGVSADWLLGLSDETPNAQESRRDPAGDTQDRGIDYWRTLAISQQDTISKLTALLAEGRATVAAPVRTGGRGVTKSA